MPTYQYRCADCGHFFEIVQSFSEDSLTECPECTGTLRKVFNAVGVVFKGSGFYKTDSRGKSTASDSSSGSSSGTSSTTSGDSGSSSTSTSTSGGSGTSKPAAAAAKAD